MRAEERLAALGECRDGVDGARLDVPDEEPDVGAGDERLAAPGDDDALHGGIAGGGVECLVQLRDDLLVERVHRVGPIDGQRRDAVGDLGANQREAERPGRPSLAVERRRHGQVPTRRQRRDEIAVARSIADVVHQLERAAAPPQADARADVGVLDRARRLRRRARRRRRRPPRRADRETTVNCRRVRRAGELPRLCRIRPVPASSAGASYIGPNARPSVVAACSAIGTPVTFISSNGPMPMPNAFFAASSIGRPYWRRLPRAGARPRSATAGRSG